MKLDKVADVIESSVKETLSYMDFPSEHWTRLRTNNALVAGGEIPIPRMLCIGVVHLSQPFGNPKSVGNIKCAKKSGHYPFRTTSLCKNQILY